jgi:hypothetical protein
MVRVLRWPKFERLLGVDSRNGAHASANGLNRRYLAITARFGQGLISTDFGHPAVIGTSAARPGTGLRLSECRVRCAVAHAQSGPAPWP